VAHEDLDALLDDLVGCAQFLLAKNGAFYPFSAVMDVGGGILHVNGYTGE
jgi:hypothetical protein